MASLTVMAVTSVEDRLRGSLTRWLLEVKPGVYAGRLSARVAEELWSLVQGHASKGTAVMIRQSNSDQGFTVRSFGDSTREFRDFDGAILAITTKTSTMHNRNMSKW